MEDKALVKGDRMAPRQVAGRWQEGPQEARGWPILLTLGLTLVGLALGGWTGLLVILLAAVVGDQCGL